MYGRSAGRDDVWIVPASVSRDDVYVSEQQRRPGVVFDDNRREGVGDVRIYRRGAGGMMTRRGMCGIGAAQTGMVFPRSDSGLRQALSTAL